MTYKQGQREGIKHASPPPAPPPPPINRDLEHATAMPPPPSLTQTGLKPKRVVKKIASDSNFEQAKES
jgi:hypothetical protein